MIFEKIRNEIINNPALFAIFSNRVFYRKPLEEIKSDPYMTMLRQNLDGNDCTDLTQVRFILFDKDAEQLESSADTLRQLFFNKGSIDGDANLFLAVFLSRQDADEQLKNAFYWTILINPVIDLFVPSIQNSLEPAPVLLWIYHTCRIWVFFDLAYQDRY